MKLLILFFISCFTQSGLAANYNKILSLNLCVDQVLPYLVAADSVKSLTHLSTDPVYGTLPDNWRSSIYYHSGSVEEILSLQPDIVLATHIDNPAKIEMLKKAGLNVKTYALPVTLMEIETFISSLALELGVQIPDLQLTSTFSIFKNNYQPGTRAALFEPNGFSASSNPFKQDLIEFTGLLINHNNSHIVSLEELLAQENEIIILDHGSANKQSLSHKLFTMHPAVKNQFANTENRQLKTVDTKNWICATPAARYALEQIAEGLL